MVKTSKVIANVQPEIEKLHQKAVSKIDITLVGGIYVRLFLKDPEFPLQNPKRFLEGLLLSSIASTHYEGQAVDPELPLLLSAALVSLLRVYPALADHVGFLGYVPKLVSAVAYEASRESMASWRYSSEDETPQQNPRTPQECVCLSCLCVLHQLAGSTTCAVVPLLMKAIGWQGGSIPALETLKCVVVAGIRAKGLLKVGVVEVLIGLLDWRGGFYLQMNWNEQPSKLEANGKTFKSSKTSSE
ncbi:DnaJ subfamily C grv2 [Orobanche minor]